MRQNQGNFDHSLYRKQLYVEDLSLPPGNKNTAQLVSKIIFLGKVHSVQLLIKHKVSDIIMKQDQIHVAMVYNKSHIHNTVEPRVFYHFFMEALPRHKHLDVSFIGHYANRLDVDKIARDYDVVLLPQINEMSTVIALKGIKDKAIPVIAFADDPHSFLKTNVLRIYSELKIDWAFGHYPPSAVYKYYPQHIKFRQIPFGVEPTLYENVRPWSERVDDWLVLSGVLDSQPLLKRLYFRFYKRRPAPLGYNYHYKLRTRCSNLPYVIHTRSIRAEQGSDHLPELLSAFRGAIAATTTFPTIKYMETPAAGCLTFMEVTEQNDAATLGYEDGKSAIFINDSNYKSKFQEYLNDPHDKKWKRIADSGRSYTLKYLTNDTAADKLHHQMRVMLGEESMTG